MREVVLDTAATTTHGAPPMVIDADEDNPVPSSVTSVAPRRDPAAGAAPANVGVYVSTPTFPVAMPLAPTTTRRLYCPDAPSPIVQLIVDVVCDCTSHSTTTDVLTTLTSCTCGFTEKPAPVMAMTTLVETVDGASDDTDAASAAL